MTKITTDDCRRFLADLYKKHPDRVRNQCMAVWRDQSPEQIKMDQFEYDEDVKYTEMLERNAVNPKKWKRESKVSNLEYTASLDTGGKTVCVSEYDLSPNAKYYHIPVEHVVCIRTFYLDGCDGGFAHEIIETIRGELILGEDISD